LNHFAFFGDNNVAPWIILILGGVALVVLMFVLPTLTNRKRSAAISELRNGVGKGDLIKTVSGVIGTVVDVEDISPVDRVLVIETGAKGRETTLRMDIGGMLMIMKKAGQSQSEEVSVADEEPSFQDEAIALPQVTTEVVASSDNQAEIQEEEVKAEAKPKTKPEAKPKAAPTGKSPYKK